MQHKIMETKAIRELSAYEDAWAIKVRIVRKTSRETFHRQDKTTEVLKIFLLDDEGSLIQATLFNEVINKFYEILETGKSYVIRNGSVRPVNKVYNNVNDNIEITFTQRTEVEEVIHDILYKRTKPFVNFNDVQKFSKGQLMDVVGVVVKVRPAYVVIMKNHGNKARKKREVILLDNNGTTMKLDLWGDLAQNEGEILESMVKLGPVIAALNVEVNEYGDETRLQTSFISMVEVNPPIEETTILQQSLEDLSMVGGGMNIALGPSKRMTESDQVSLTSIVSSKLEDKYYTFIGNIEKILNKNSPWYEKCGQCNYRVYPDGNNKTVNCTNCGLKNSSFMRHYKLFLLLSDGNEKAYATLFEAAEALIGCPVNVFAEKLLTIQDNDTFSEYTKLMSCEGKRYKFLVKLDSKKRGQKAGNSIIVEEVLEVDKDSCGGPSNKRKLDDLN